MKHFNWTRLQLVMARRKMDVHDLATATDINISVVNGYCMGSIEPSVSDVDKIARATNWPREFFFGPTLDRLEWNTLGM